jgi:hypothetical protein
VRPAILRLGFSAFRQPPIRCLHRYTDSMRMTRTTNRSLTILATGLISLSLVACASNKPKDASTTAKAEKAEKQAPGPQALGYTIMNSQGEPLYCQQIRPVGSNVARTRRCMTAKEWQQAQDNDRRAVEELRRGYDYPK